MKSAALIARLLLGLIFFVLGLIVFLPFIPEPPLPAGTAGQFLSALMQSHFQLVVSAVQVVGGALLLLNRYVPLALVLLGPVIVNIFLFHLLMSPSGLPLVIGVVILWAIVALRYRRYFSSLFVRQAD